MSTGTGKEGRKDSSSKTRDYYKKGTVSAPSSTHSHSHSQQGTKKHSGDHGDNHKDVKSTINKGSSLHDAHPHRPKEEKTTTSSHDGHHKSKEEKTTRETQDGHHKTREEKTTRETTSTMPDGQQKTSDHSFKSSTTTKSVSSAASKKKETMTVHVTETIVKTEKRSLGASPAPSPVIWEENSPRIATPKKTLDNVSGNRKSFNDVKQRRISNADPSPYGSQAKLDSPNSFKSTGNLPREESHGDSLGSSTSPTKANRGELSSPKSSSKTRSTGLSRASTARAAASTLQNCIALLVNILEDCRLITEVIATSIGLPKDKVSGRLEEAISKALDVGSTTRTIYDKSPDNDQVVPPEELRELEESVKEFAVVTKAFHTGSGKMDACVLGGEKVKSAVKKILAPVIQWKTTFQDQCKVYQSDIALCDLLQNVNKVVREVNSLGSDFRSPETIVDRTKSVMNAIGEFCNLSQTSGGLQDETFALNVSAKKLIVGASKYVEAHKNKANLQTEEDQMDSAVKDVLHSVDVLKKAAETENSQRDKRKKNEEREITEDEKNSQKIAEMRGNVLKELFETENTYLNQLTELNKGLITPLRNIVQEGKEKSIVKSLAHPAIKAMVDSLPAIAETSSRIRDGLLTRMSRNDSDIGSIFLELATLLHKYQDYVNNFDVGSAELVTQREKNKKLEKVFIKFAEDSGKLDVGMLLILPIQRPPRYQLLLEQMCKFTKKNTQSYKNLTAALDKMKVINHNINLRKKEADNRAKLMEIEKSLLLKKDKSAPSLWSPGRMYVREGILERVEKAFLSFLGNVTKEFYVYMFSDILLVTRNKHFHSIIPLNKCAITDVGSDGGVNNVFYLEHEDDKKRGPKDKSKPLSTSWSSWSEVEKASWMKDISEAISILKLMNDVKS